MSGHSFNFCPMLCDAAWHHFYGIRTSCSKAFLLLSETKSETGGHSGGKSGSAMHTRNDITGRSDARLEIILRFPITLVVEIVDCKIEIQIVAELLRHAYGKSITMSMSK